MEKPINTETAEQLYLFLLGERYVPSCKREVPPDFIAKLEVLVQRLRIRFETIAALNLLEEERKSGKWGV